MTELLPESPVPGDSEVPSRLAVLPLKETVVFPESMTPLAIGQERSVRLIEDVMAGERVLALVTVRDPEIEIPGWDDLYEVGTAAIIHKLIRVPDGTLRELVQGQLAGGIAHVRLAVDFNAGQHGGFVQVRRNQRRPRNQLADDGLLRVG